MKYLIKKLLREGLLDEDYATQNEMKELTDELYMQICESLVKKAYNNKTSEIELPELYYPFEYLTKNYNALSDFINEFKIKLDSVYKYRYEGSFRGAGPKSGVIILKLDMETIESSLEKNVIPYLDSELTPELQNKMTRSVYSSTYIMRIISTLLHELQHAYDYWRSGGKYTKDKRSREYYDKYTNDGEMSPEQYEQYMKLQHEINARFSQAIDDMYFYEYNMGKDKSLPMRHKIIKDFNIVLNEFKTKFRGYNMMPPTVKKRLLNRLGKMYQEATESLNNQ